MDGGQQEVRPVGTGHQRIYGQERAAGQFRVIGQHDGYLRPDLLDLVSDRCAVQQAQVVLEHNCIHMPRHEKT
jgi:hypothetical protein